MDYGQNVMRLKEIFDLARTEHSIALSWQQQIVVFSICPNTFKMLVKWVRLGYDTFIEQRTCLWVKKTIT